MVFSLEVRTAREDGWDRDAIVRGFSVIGISGRGDGRGRDRSLGDSDRTAWPSPLHLQRLWTTHRPGAIDSGADLGGSAVGGTPRDARLRAAASRLSVVRDPDRAHRVRGSE